MSNESRTHAPILVDLTSQGMVMRTSSSDPFSVELAQKSTKAIKGAMDAVEGMVEEVNATIDRLAGNPDELEFSFGLSFDIEGNAMIAKASAGAAIGVKVTWKRKGRTTKPQVVPAREAGHA